MPRLRLGVALLLPAPVAEEVDGLRRALGDGSRERVPPHITLVPPVNVREEHVGDALALMRSAAAATPPELVVALGPPTSFLPVNAVLYLSVGGDVPGLMKLRDRMWAPPLSRTLTWPYVPHVTLADDTSAERIAAAVTSMADYRVTTAFDRIHLLVERRSEARGATGATGPRWVPVADAAFGPPAIVSRGGPLAVELVRSRLIDPEARALLAAASATPGAAGAAASATPGAAGAAASATPGAAGAAGAAGSGAEDLMEYQGEGIVVTARREGDVVGVGRAWLAVDRCRATVVVAGEHRNQGIGRHISAALEAAAADAGWACEFPRTLTEDPAG